MSQARVDPVIANTRERRDWEKVPSDGEHSYGSRLAREEEARQMEAALQESLREWVPLMLSLAHRAMEVS
ncbi:hypothetical protein Pmar_PMAR011657 [Perkinsus marinus ATCC 50983]|uniref:Uncharacterized protein n=1 Tax=Perkinsus marinus (strain ATCC 50983 / TXsc) TaxID=423536 RepID=C5LCE6_PERM5|nr:hypothetical protein Pmar_PMAR011657 [Perkinsus marinus ATCC 50983]EER05629.1 hypothetical protein Pmar_PMAR011657 [Perkinsus marinus ATCC 50983]|eukprot:XP_002773813.1 hypothetical protein Pmar_PMAR011657 [Perkinsus marinus ATCC 50983]